MTAQLAWPFFDEEHRRLAPSLTAWAKERLGGDAPHDESVAGVDARSRELVAMLGKAGWLRHAVRTDRNGPDVRTLCLLRESLAWHDGLADFAFAMQGLGAGPITLFGTDEQREQWLPRVAEGSAIGAFALSEPEAGSDVAAISTTARETAGGYVLNGTKTWISNGGIADFYIVFARTGDGKQGLTAFLVRGENRGLVIEERIQVIAPHPLARLGFKDCFVPDSARIGPLGGGMRVALSVLDVFRSTVGAAALGFAKRAQHEALQRSVSRQLFGAPMGELQMVQAKLADMETHIDAAALLIYRAAWQRDVVGGRITREAAMAKLYATDHAQVVIDDAVQILGGNGVVSGNPVEKLYRDIRALRIYEGASDVQKVVIARDALARAAAAKSEA